MAVFRRQIEIETEEEGEEKAEQYDCKINQQEGAKPPLSGKSLIHVYPYSYLITLHYPVVTGIYTKKTLK